jgi:double-stranded uracil-DNA glycosylase
MTSPLRLTDIISKGLAIVFCGINPGLTAARSGHHFSSPSNRFWRVLHEAGFTPMRIKAEDDRSILDYGYGLTTVVARATRGADEVSANEFLLACATLKRKMVRYSPRVIAFLGKAAYRSISGDQDIPWGIQPAHFAGSLVWVLPNPSGLNRGFKTSELVREYRKLRLDVTGKSQHSNE